MPDEEYIQGLEKWREDMDANLRRENERLALAGLFWLQKGFNTFGSSPESDILLPKPAPRIIGAFEFDGQDVTLTLDLGQTVELNGHLLQAAAKLNADDSEAPSYVSYQSLRMVVIRRAHGVGVRLWDNNRPERTEYPPRLWFPPDEASRVIAIYTPYPVPIKVMLPNALDEVQTDYMNGYVNFRLLEKSHRLEASELEDGRLYMQFKDLTNGESTYANGRYVYSDVVTEEGQLKIDFNKAFNPPAAFSPFSTSTFAPKQNILKIPVEAGEKMAVPSDSALAGESASITA
jgi:uncharacterized protein